MPYVIFTVSLPLLWWLSVALARGYNARFVGLGSDEFRRVLNAAASLTAGIAIVSYLTKSDIARGYVVVALPLATVLDLAATVRTAQTAAPAAALWRVHAQDDRGGLRGRRRRPDH